MFPRGSTWSTRPHQTLRLRRALALPGAPTHPTLRGGKHGRSADCDKEAVGCVYETLAPDSPESRRLEDSAHLGTRHAHGLLRVIELPLAMVGVVALAQPVDHAAEVGWNHGDEKLPIGSKDPHCLPYCRLPIGNVVETGQKGDRIEGPSSERQMSGILDHSVTAAPINDVHTDAVAVRTDKEVAAAPDVEDSAARVAERHDDALVIDGHETEAQRTLS